MAEFSKKPERRFTSLENFKPNPDNRLNPFQNFLSLEYIHFVYHDIRSALTNLLKKGGWPKCPQKKIHSLEGLFKAAAQVVTEMWQSIDIQNLLTAKFSEWELLLSNDEENRSIKTILSNPKEMEKLLQIRQLGSLEPLRSMLPQAWKTLILISSERNFAIVALLSHWAKNLPNRILNEMGTSKTELQLLQMVGSLGKFFDHAYLKQIELAEAPGGTMSSHLSRKRLHGAEYLYDPYVSKQSKKIKLMSYAEVFPFEWERIVKRFRFIAQQVSKMIAANELSGDGYEEFPRYLNKLADVYGSLEKDPAKLYAMWQGVEHDCMQMISNGCPISLIPQSNASVAGDADKVDVELRVGVVTEIAKKFKSMLEKIRQHAQLILNGYLQGDEKLLVKQIYPIPPILITYQVFAFGPNLHWHTRGESTMDFILSHANAIGDTALSNELPLVANLFAVEDILPEKYIDAALLETSVHEIGHAIFTDCDEYVHTRIGNDKHSAVLEELKAETLGMRLLSDQIQSHQIALDVHYQFLAKMGTLTDYLANKSQEKGSSGERYYYPAMYLFCELLNHQVLEETNGKYAIKDVYKGMEIMGQIGTSILERFYANSNSSHQNVIQYVKSLRQKVKKDKKVERFCRRAKEIFLNQNKEL